VKAQRGACFRSRVITASLAGAILTLAPAAGAAEPPAGKHYGAVLVLRVPDGVVLTAQACMHFTRKKMCGTTTCGTWQINQSAGSQNEWTGEILENFGDFEALLVFAGRTETSGAGSSIGATIHIPALGLNGAVSGTQMSRRECRAFAFADGEARIVGDLSSVRNRAGVGGQDR